MNNTLREQFPSLNRKVNGHPLVYLDNAATSQKPQVVIDEIVRYYSEYNANVHRGIHTLSQEATLAMENSREKIRDFLNAEKVHEIIFTRGVTESINLLANGLEPLFSPEDEIIITELEHHSNIVPWQMLAQRTGAKLRFVPINEEGTWDVTQIDALFSERTKLVACNAISNALGVVNPFDTLFQKAREFGAYTFLDAAQLAPHGAMDVQKLDCDFLAFSGHKMYAPTGVGVLYGKETLLEQMNPYHGGGEMIKDVFMSHSTYAGLPFKFEAGTPNICGNIVLGTAIDFMKDVGIADLQAHEKSLVDYTIESLNALDEVRIVAPNATHMGAVSFNLMLNGVHPSDVGLILDKKGIAVRTGHHCAQPIMRKLVLEGTIRASFAVYNTREEIDLLQSGIKTAIRLLG